MISEKDGMAQIYIPAGNVLMGSTKADIDAALQPCSGCPQDMLDRETPQHSVY